MDERQYAARVPHSATAVKLIGFADTSDILVQPGTADTVHVILITNDGDGRSIGQPLIEGDTVYVQHVRREGSVLDGSVKAFFGGLDGADGACIETPPQQVRVVVKVPEGLNVTAGGRGGVMWVRGIPEAVYLTYQ